MVYLDYNATTPMDERVINAVVPFFHETFGNPSGLANQHGRDANRAVKRALRTISNYFSTESTDDVIFTSGSTESNNQLIESFAGTAEHPARILTTKLEHDSVLSTVRAKAPRVITDYVQNGADGVIDLEDLERKIRPDTALISIMAANNEIGSIQPVREIAEIAHRHGIPFHSDATQLIPYERIDLSETGIDYLSLSGHKICAQKGVGLLICKDDAALSKIQPLIYGGSQQNGYRSGTLNVPGIVGIGKAIEILNEQIEQDAEHCKLLSRRFLEVLDSHAVAYHVNGSLEHRIPGNISLALKGFTASQLMGLLPEYSFSAGSACSTGKKSHVLAGIGCPDEIASGTIRVSFGRFSTEEEITGFAERLASLQA